MKIIEVSTQSRIEAKQIEIQAKVDAYKTAQINQLKHGGPGPVADCEIMSIVNEHDGQFEVVAKEQEIIEE